MPPNRWFHQHFNVGRDKARYLALHPPKQFHGYSDEKVGDVSRDQIEYADEDPWVRAMFEEELAKRQISSLMPAEAYQDRNYQWDYRAAVGQNRLTPHIAAVVRARFSPQRWGEAPCMSRLSDAAFCIATTALPRALSPSIAAGSDNRPSWKCRGLEVDSYRCRMRAEPGQDRAKLGFNGQVVVVRCPHRNQAAHLAHQPIAWNQVQQVLQRAGVRGPEYRRGQQVHIRRHHPAHHSLRVVGEVGQGAVHRQTKSDGPQDATGLWSPKATARPPTPGPAPKPGATARDRSPTRECPTTMARIFLPI